MKEESLLLLSDLQKLINQVVLIDYTIIILGGIGMDTVMSHDYRLLMGKISMDLSFAEKFFNSAETVLADYSITADEKLKLLGLSAEKFQAYRKAIDLKTCDCDSCCNGGEAKGNCSECFASCCQ